MSNFSKLVHYKVVTWCGHRGFRPALVNSVYVYVCTPWYTKSEQPRKLCAQKPV